ncbi:hypothetical protein NDU88_001081 [Pleurodeles waltl]|uniref:Uncharacterized protein n=1 Tax=Pleurodeles waltl TaxID=8319 RepID=A0AAV7URT0_PLEWA|nr:hypothetical protein NDU88_001081 [Pleurodeles waltl]
MEKCQRWKKEEGCVERRCRLLQKQRSRRMPWSEETRKGQPRSGKNVAHPDQWVADEKVLITCVHGDSKIYPVAIIQINWRGKEESHLVGVIPDLGEDLILVSGTLRFAKSQ